MKREKWLGFFVGSLVAITVITVRAKAEETDMAWGELGYANPSTPEVEALPIEDEVNASLTDAPAPHEDQSLDTLELKTVAASASVSSEDLAPAPKKSLPEISTVKNTYGVMTEERTPIRIYGAPFAGIASVIGNDTADVTPRFAVGGALGVLISSNMLLEAGYTYNEQDFSNPRINTTSGIFLQNTGSMFTLKQNVISAGAKLFVLGRESRLRPFLGGGLGYARGTLNYTDAAFQYLGGQSQYLANFTLNQWDGYGELGAELAITRQFVANLSFKLSGVLSSSTSNDTQTNLAIDPSKSDVGNSLSRSASYVLGAGVGIYF